MAQQEDRGLSVWSLHLWPFWFPETCMLGQLETLHSALCVLGWAPADGP